MALIGPALAYTSIYRSSVKPAYKRFFATKPGLALCAGTAFALANTVFVVIGAFEDVGDDANRDCLPPNVTAT
eukprot:SAG31_NODE_4797_length_2952_cov_6.463722_5_plen_73_part_00